MDRLTESQLLSTTDARAWAREFLAVWSELKVMDEGWLIGWFANAIETGRSAGLRSIESVRSEALESLSDLIKVLENVHDSHKRKGLPLTNSQFAKLNKARSIIHALNAAPPVSSRTQMPENSGKRPAVAAPALSPARVAEVPVAEAHGFTIRGPQAHQIAAALNAVAPESPAKEQTGEQNGDADVRR